MPISDRLQDLIQREARKPNTPAVLLGVHATDGRVEFSGAAGAAEPDSPYFIASVTKTYTVAALLQLVDAGQLDLEAPLSAYLPAARIQGIHVYRGVDYSGQLKIYQLMHQTSGLADYFEGKSPDGTSVMADIRRGVDRRYGLDEILATVRQQTPRFAPDARGGRKSDYSDTNYQLLGAVIEAVTGCALAEVFAARIFDPLGLARTYLFDGAAPEGQPEPLPLYVKARATAIPGIMASEGAAGGIVSTVPESLAFLHAFFEGRLFDAAHLPRLQRWNALFFPLQYGYGLMRFKLPRPMTLFRYSPELIGHSGASGSFAFYEPRQGLYLAGTFNQAATPARPFFFMVRVVQALRAAASG